MANFVKAIGDRTIRSLIDMENGTVNREAYVNDDVFDQEMEQIFQRCWLFLGHESQLPNPGDFVISRMGTEEVIVVRDRKDKQIRVFLNSCRHRGMKVCRYDEGNNLVFTCPFHAWTYDTKGALVGVGFGNHETAYTDTRPGESWGLAEVAQFKNFYGSLWATWDPKAPSFEDYLGPYAQSLRHCLQSSDGEDNGLEFFTPFQRHRLPTNWKVPGFTSVTDLTHTAMTHRSSQAAGLHQDRGQGKEKLAPFPSEKYASGDHNLGHGGMTTFWLQQGVPEYTNEWFEEGVDEYFRGTSLEKGRKFAHEIMPSNGWGGGHFAIFPCTMVDSWRLRWYHPHATGMTERWTLTGVDKKAPKYVKDALRHYGERFNGPIGFFESDDMENWNYVFPASQGAKARKLNYFYANGIGHGKYDDRLPGVVVNGEYTEEAQRARFSRWLAFMEAKSWEDLYPVNKAANHHIWPGIDGKVTAGGRR
jgi:phenylpropionate dioxygenase-like ring-hydroxylating dioxygenase large terminal subunit